jgi:hypothetical protein
MGVDMEIIYAVKFMTEGAQKIGLR